nr:hypothetical protein [Tanacetum cinerariifolium]
MMEYKIELTDPIPQTPHDSPLLGGHTPGSDEGSMTQKELTDLCTTLLQKVLDLENVKTAQAKEIASLKKRVTKLEQRQSLRISGFHPLGRRKVSKQERKNLKSQQKFQDIDDLLDEGGSTAETVSTARPDISVARPEVSTAEPKNPPTTATLFDDEDVTITDTLASLAEMYDEVQAQIDADHELAVRLTHEEQQKSFEEIQKLYIKEQKWVDAFVPIGFKKDEKRIRSRKKRAAGSSSKHKSPKKQK